MNKKYLNRKLKMFIDSDHEYLAVIRYRNDPDPPWLDKRFLLSESNKLNRIKYATDELMITAEELESAFREERVTYID